MASGIYAWMVPFVLATFALAFAMLRLNGIGSFWWSGAFGAGAIAFAFSLFVPAADAVAKPVIEDFVFLVAFACLLNGTAKRFQVKAANGVVLAILVSSTLSAFLALWLGNGNVALELVAVQLGCAGLLLLTIGIMYRRIRALPDRFLLWLCVLFVGNLVTQSLFMLALPDATLSINNWRDSTSGFILHFSGATAGVMFAVAVLTMIGRDMMEGLRKTSETDSLSGLLNRRGFERVCAAHGTPDAPTCVLVVDIDHFKTVNDRYGHLAGDAVICAFAALLQQMAGKNALVARTGGEEFILLLPRTSLIEGRERAERMREAFAAIRWPAPMNDAWLTASFGLTDLAPGEAPSAASDRADRLLYFAKRGGRNRLCACTAGSTLVLPDPGGVDSEAIRRGIAFA